MQLSEINAYLPISEAIATAGQPTTEQLPLIQQAGFATVINLALTTSTDAIPDEKERVEQLGMTYIHIPVEWEAPQVSDLEQFFEAVTASKTAPVFIHCAANMRVSAFMYLYHRLRCQMPHEEAVVYLNQIWSPNSTWQAFIDQALQRSSP
ncbi:MAG TPA: protein tyrosine phosphatase family protein [Leptolyngbyaceae cyanobacterium M33_DOE_097]|uniref:Phosphatase n=1 Tax=Oscillatoriales cyanobacterium SpSt-418 TaxID=2282169 RepID=A0A7C3KDY7_9CYAN|nr:protein tyrosine phosphatase family protein [Leptolyngbyaceae cyanobacterium M33_DOE_097]